MPTKKEESINWKVGDYDLKISNPNKLYWPKEEITKLEVLDYYKSMSKVLLKYFKNRPATINYFPKGIENPSFYKRNFDDDLENEKLFHTALYNEVSQDKTIKVPLLDSQAAILWFASKGGFEFHLWSSKMPDYSQPDIAVFDLDAHKKTPFDNILKAAMYLNDYLISLGIKGYPKTSGGTGLHIYVPIVPQYTFEEVRNWVKNCSIELEKSHSELITTERVRGKTHASNRINIDHLQNVISRNTVAPYSIRGYPGATVSTPLTWEEIEKGGFSQFDFNINTVPKRVKKIGDIFSGVLSSKYHLKI